MLALVPLLFANDLDAILDNPKLSGAVVSCTVADDLGAVVYERNPGLRVMPASNQKLLSNSYALYKLGPDYLPVTRIWVRKDRVIIDSPGDPMMTHERLSQIAQRLHLGHRKAVYVHEAYRPVIPPTWELDDLPNKYAAPVTAFTVDRGSIELWGQGSRLWLEPRNYGILAQRGLKSGKRKVNYDPIRRRLTVDGDLPKTPTRLDTLGIDYPDAAASTYLGDSFHILDSAPTTEPTATSGGPPLRVTMKECLVKSDNNLAENLLLMAAGPLGKDPYQEAADKLSGFLKDVVGVEPADFRPVDGSGMSRHNLVTTRGLVKLLQWALKQPTKDVWLDALVKPGTGTLGGRLQDVPFIGKTGTLDSVVALSGYVRTTKGRTLTVSLILNHFVCTGREARLIADDFMKKVAADKGFGTDSAPASRYEARPAHPRSDPADGDRHGGSDHHGVDARERDDRRAESRHALLPGAERVALRGR